MRPPATIRPARPEEFPACERILRSLPDWFGIEEAIVAYVKDLAGMETFVAEVPDGIGGFLALSLRSEAAGEIHLMAVAPQHHRAGLGRALVRRAEEALRARGFEYLQVKTLGPSRPNEAYAGTRAFYTRLGFRPLEENALWGSANPCLIMVKHLPCGTIPVGNDGPLMRERGTGPGDGDRSLAGHRVVPAGPRPPRLPSGAGRP